MSGWGHEEADGWDQSRPAGGQRGSRPALGPETSSQLVALRELEHLSIGQERGYHPSWPPVPAMPATAPPAAPPSAGSPGAAGPAGSSGSSGFSGASGSASGAAAAAAAAAAANGERAAGRHHASQSRGDELLRRHGNRFASFSAIGGGIFIAGLLIQAGLTSGLHVSSLISYLVQAVVSVEASYFLNRWLTWKGTRTPFWGSFLRFNLQKVVTVTLNLVAYGVLLKLGVEYLLDNILLTIVFTFVNYIGADRLVFLRGGRQMVAAVTGPIPVITGPMPVLRVDQQPAPHPRSARRELPTISVVIPVRGNEATIRAAVESILHQDYPLLRELILVGSPGDSTWSALRDVDDPRLFVMETETPPGIRDANFKRDLGIRQTAGDLVSLIDSDMVIPPDWMSNAVRLLMENEVDCVAGVMRSIHDDFWGRFVDGNRLGAKTPRAQAAYLVTAEGFGAAEYKPPITADILFTKAMYEDCPIDGTWSHGSLEDYEWFWRVVERGHKVLVSNQLFGWHHHRSGFKKLTGEYRRSARGCAYFIRAHRDSPFAQKRMTQAIVLPLGAFTVLAGVGVAAFMGHGLLAAEVLGGLAVVGLLLLSGREFVRSRSLESLLYPVPALVLGINYTASLATHLIRNSPLIAGPVAQSGTADGAGAPAPRRGLSRLFSPLTFILAVQAGLSLTMVWSNTAFGDEAQYLSEGRLEWSHWLHGTPSYVFHDSGAPQIYPVVGALADKLGGLAGARILSVIFMLAATAMIYAIGSRLFGTVAAFSGAALWAVSEPALRLSFATFDPMACMLVIASVYVAMQSAYARKKAELVVASGLLLMLAAVTAESFAIMIPAVVLVSFLIWQATAGTASAVWCACWQSAIAIAVAAGFLTAFHLWKDAIGSTITRGNSAKTLGQGLTLVIRAAWSWDGLIFGLAVAGAIVAFRAGRGPLVSALALSILLVPVYQAHLGTASSMDKHISAGSGLAAIAAGYAISRVRLSLPVGRISAAAAVVALLAIPAITGLWYAKATFNYWPNEAKLMSVASTFSPSERVLVNTANGSFSINQFVYYLPNYRWINRKSVEDAQIMAGAYAGIIIDLDASDADTEDLPTAAMKSESGLHGKALAVAAADDGALLKAIDDSHDYAFVIAIPYRTADSSNASGYFVVWRKVNKPAPVKTVKPAPPAKTKQKVKAAH